MPKLTEFYICTDGLKKEQPNNENWNQKKGKWPLSVYKVLFLDKNCITDYSDEENKKFLHRILLRPK